MTKSKITAMLNEVRLERAQSREAMERNNAMQRNLQGDAQKIAQDIERCNGAEVVLSRLLEKENNNASDSKPPSAPSSRRKP